MPPRVFQPVSYGYTQHARLTPESLANARLIMAAMRQETAAIPNGVYTPNAQTWTTGPIYLNAPDAQEVPGMTKAVNPTTPKGEFEMDAD